MGHENGGWMNDDQRSATADLAKARMLKLSEFVEEIKDAILEWGDSNRPIPAGEAMAMITNCEELIGYFSEQYSRLA